MLDLARVVCEGRRVSKVRECVCVQESEGESEVSGWNPVGA